MNASADYGANDDVVFVVSHGGEAAGPGDVAMTCWIELILGVAGIGMVEC